MSGLWYHFPHAVVCRASGKDARRYLNNRLSNDLRTLSHPESTIAAALTAQGKVQGLYTVFVTKDDAFLLVCDGGARQALFAALGKFIVADRVSLEDLSSSWILIHTLAREDQVDALVREFEPGSVFIRRCQRLAGGGCDILISTKCPEESLRVIETRLGSPLSTEEYRFQRISRGRPSFPEEIHEGVILTECGMRDAVSFAKGCYVGQEVIERSDAIGKLPRTLERVAFSGVQIPEGASIVNAHGESIGKVVSVALDGKNSTACAFAMLRTGVYSVGDSIQCEGVQGRVQGL